MCDEKLSEVSRSQIKGRFINIYGLFAKDWMWDEIAGRACFVL
jgi:hypothetical protein